MQLSGSPAFKPEYFESSRRGNFVDAARSTTMTISGAVSKTALCLILCIASAVGVFAAVQNQSVSAVIPLLGGSIVGAVLSLIMFFAPKTATFLAIPYSICQGAFLGAISLFYAQNAAGTKFGGTTGLMIVANAAICTFATLSAMLILYRAGIIRATQRFKSVMLIVTGAVLLYAIATIVMSLLGVMPKALLGGPIAIGICVALVIYGALLLIMDFDLVESGQANNAPKYMEWYSAFATLSTLVFIYLQFLRLLSLLNKR
jgi:uncharacterized YccA/Bax inhibitor family protein